MVRLYHFGEAICAQKVRLALAEKGVEWEGIICAGPGLRDPAYLRLNPSGVVPTLVHDGAVITESRIISEYVEDAFDGPRLMPLAPRERHRARFWSKRVDDRLHLNVFILTFAAHARDLFLALPAEARERAMPGLRDPIKRRIASDLLDTDVDSPFVTAAIEVFRELLADMEAQLQTSAHLAGSDYSLADADYTAYIRRLSDLGLSGLWDNKPALQDWWARAQKRPSYQSAILAWISPEETERYRIARKRLAPQLYGTAA